jgi:DNA-binding MarR family transcriptional regulator
MSNQLPPEVPELSVLPESLQFLRLIWAFHIGLDRTSDDMTSNLGVSGRQRFILRVVGLIPGMTVDQLSAMLRVNRSVLEADVSPLVAKGLLASRTGVAEAPPLLSLTGSGAVVNATAAGTVESAVSRALDEATPYERAAFRRMLERVTPYLNGHGSR